MIHFRQLYEMAIYYLSIDPTLTSRIDSRINVAGVWRRCFGVPDAGPASGGTPAGSPRVRCMSDARRRRRLDSAAHP